MPCWKEFFPSFQTWVFVNSSEGRKEATPPFEQSVPWPEGVVSPLLQRCASVFSSHRRTSTGEVSCCYGATSPAFLTITKQNMCFICLQLHDALLSLRCHFSQYSCLLKIEELGWKQSNPWCAEKPIVVAAHLSKNFSRNTDSDGTPVFASSSPLSLTFPC